MKTETPFEIVGAGPSGLAAAITLAKAGRKVVVHEAKGEVGSRFRRDLQGLENWTDHNILEFLQSLGIEINFRHKGFHQGFVYDAWNQPYPVTTQEPFFYMVERGPGPGTLDDSLLQQALQLGVEVRFHSRIKELDEPSIFGIGPRSADAMASGYQFTTTDPDGFWAICDDSIAPRGYSYLLIWNGIGTVKSCMFSDFKRAKECAEATVERFQNLVGFTMNEPRFHSGIGNFYHPGSAESGKHLVIGEQRGFQDALFGFGMRHAILTGVLAARSILENTSYDQLWQQQLSAGMKSCIVNRVIYDRLGSRGYRWVLRKLKDGRDPRLMLQRFYGPMFLKTLLYPWAKRKFAQRRVRLLGREQNHPQD